MNERSNASKLHVAGSRGHDNVSDWYCNSLEVRVKLNWSVRQISLEGIPSSNAW